MKRVEVFSFKVCSMRVTLRDYGPMDILYGRRRLGPQRWALDFGRRSLVLEWHQ